MRYEIHYSCISNIGKIRNINQDNFICNGQYLSDETSLHFPISGKAYPNTPLLFGIFDGMGGEECGEVASLIAAKHASAPLKSEDPILALSEFCSAANKLICDYASAHEVASMGTTAAMLLFSEKCISLCNIGDSRIFLFSDGELNQLSVDHVTQAPFGRKPPLSQNLGIPPEEMIIDPYLSSGKYRPGDKFLICSDGITDMLTNDEISSAISDKSVTEATAMLVDTALERGGKDNITAITLEVKKKKLCLFGRK